MRINEFSIRAKNESQCVLSWVSESEEMYSWIFINGKFAIGPFIVASRDRQMTIPFSRDQAAVIEIHDFDDLEMLPNSGEEMPQIKPLLSWNPVDEAVKYRVYHGDFSNGKENLVSEINARQGVERMEINSPVELDGRNGHWYWFRTESVDEFHHESENHGELVKYFASDLPPVAELTITKQPNGKYELSVAF